MARIKIHDLSKNRKISRKEMKEVLGGGEPEILFLSGAPRRPVILGSLWNGSDEPPESRESSTLAEKYKTISFTSG